MAKKNKKKDLETVFEQDASLRILSFDPAVTKMGYALLERNKDGLYTVLLSGDIDGRKITKDKQKKLIFKNAGSYCTTLAIEECVKDLVKEHSPDIVTCESAFVHSFPAAFASLILVINTIRRAVDQTLGTDIYTVAPMQTKKYISGKSDAKKDAMKIAVETHDRISLPKRDPDYSEHEIDAIGHGVTAVELRIKT